MNDGRKSIRHQDMVLKIKRFFANVKCEEKMIERNVLFLYTLMNDVYELNMLCMLYGVFFFLHCLTFCHVSNMSSVSYNAACTILCFLKTDKHYRKHNY